MNKDILEMIDDRDKALSIANKFKSNKLLRQESNVLRNKV